MDHEDNRLREGAQEEGGDEPEEIAEEMGETEDETFREEHPGTDDGQGETENKGLGEARAEQGGGADGDEDGSEIGEQRRIGHRGELQGPVPEAEIAGEEDPGQDEQGEVGAPGGASRRRLPAALEHDLQQQRRQRQEGAMEPGASPMMMITPGVSLMVLLLILTTP